MHTTYATRAAWGQALIGKSADSRTAPAAVVRRAQVTEKIFSGRSAQYVRCTFFKSEDLPARQEAKFFADNDDVRGRTRRIFKTEGLCRGLSCNAFLHAVEEFFILKETFMNIAKRLTAAAATIAAAACIAALAACRPQSEVTEGDIPEQAQVTAVENEYGGHDYVFTVTEGVITLGQTTTLYDYIEALETKGEIEVEATDGAYGKYITAAGGVEERYEGTNAMYYWAVYTDLVELDGVTYSSPDYTYENGGKTLNSASYGVSGLPAVEGYTYALVYTYTSW